MNISFLTVFLNLAFFLVIILISRKNFLIAIAVLISSLIINLLIIDNNLSFWVRKIGIDEQIVRDKIIFSLDHCTPNLNLEFCRALYNKPVFLLNKIATGVVLQFSEENILSFLQIPFKSVLVLLSYIGILSLIAAHSKSKTINVFKFWIFLYGALGIFGEYNQALALIFLGLFLFLIAYGSIKIISGIRKFNEIY